MDYAVFTVSQIAVDVFLVAGIFYVILFIGRKGNSVDEDRVKALISALNGQVKAAGSAIEKISSETERCVGSSEEAIKNLDAKRSELQLYLERIDNLLKAMDESMPSEGLHSPDRYKEASKLAEAGYGLDEIVKRVGLPKGEVQLILGLIDRGSSCQ